MPLMNDGLGETVSKLTRYKLDERDEAVDRERWCCWFCGAPLGSPGTGRAHILEDSKYNNEIYGPYIMNHRYIFRMSCAVHNSKALTYKPDESGDIYFDEKVFYPNLGQSIKVKCGPFSKVTEEDRKHILYLARKDLEERGVDFKSGDGAKKALTERQKAHARLESARNRITGKLRYGKSKNLDDAYASFCKAWDEYNSFGYTTKLSEQRAKKSRERIEKNYSDKIKELLSEAEN